MKHESMFSRRLIAANRAAIKAADEQGAELVAAFEVQPRPTCAVRGMIQPRAMCGSVIVGGYQCGYKGTCEHQRAPGEVKEPSQCP